MHTCARTHTCTHSRAHTCTHALTRTQAVDAFSFQSCNCATGGFRIGVLGAGCAVKRPSEALSGPATPVRGQRPAVDRWDFLLGTGPQRHTAPWRRVVPERPVAQHPLGASAESTPCSWLSRPQTPGGQVPSEDGRGLPHSHSQQTRPHLWVVSETINQKELSRLAPCQGGERAADSRRQQPRVQGGSGASQCRAGRDVCGLSRQEFVVSLGLEVCDGGMCHW